MISQKPTLVSLQQDLCAMKRELTTRQDHVEEKLDQILGVIGPDSFLRKHGMRFFTAVVGAAVYAGLIDGKVGAFLGKLVGI